MTSPSTEEKKKAAADAKADAKADAAKASAAAKAKAKAAAKTAAEVEAAAAAASASAEEADAKAAEKNEEAESLAKLAASAKAEAVEAASPSPNVYAMRTDGAGHTTLCTSCQMGIPTRATRGQGGVLEWKCAICTHTSLGSLITSSSRETQLLAKGIAQSFNQIKAELGLFAA